jgi:uncharacterized protein (DUF983 family)
MMTTIKCPHCREEADVDSGFIGQLADCLKCGKEFKIAKEDPAAPIPIVKPAAVPLARVVVTDVDISFSSLVGIMIKLFLASLFIAVTLCLLVVTVFALAKLVKG